MKKIPLVTALFLFLLTFGAAAQPKGNVITVTASGEVELPADIIRFDITLNAEADTPQEAYELHKEREKVLVQLLDRYRIDDRQIRFEPITIRRENRPGQLNRQNREVVQTLQQVSVELKDFTVYEKMQVTLIENGFDRFSGRFLGSEQEEGEDRALQQALKNARHKAQIIGDELGAGLSRVVSVEYHSGASRPVYRREQAMMAAGDGSLMQFEQTVIVTASVTLKYLMVH